MHFNSKSRIKSLICAFSIGYKYYLNTANFQALLIAFTFSHIAISDVQPEISLQVLNIVILQYQIIQLLILNVFTLTIPFHFLHFRHNIEFKYLHAQLLYTIFLLLFNSTILRITKEVTKKKLFFYTNAAFLVSI